MIHVYALCDRPDLALTVTGIDARAADVLAHADFGVVMSRHQTPPSTSTATLVAHGRVCDAAMAAGCTVLPVRFGARYHDEAAVRASIDQRATAFRDALQRVRGHVEIGVRAMWPGSAEPDEGAGPPASGTAYLMSRVAAERRANARRTAAVDLACQIDDVLRPHAAAVREQILATPRLALSAAYLVCEHAVASFTDAAARLRDDHDDVQLVCTGPWPAYHFVGVEPPS